jgi:hypothetical protein
MNYTITNAQQAIDLFGEPTLARRKTLVTIRPAKGTETFKCDYGSGTLEGVEGIDYILTNVITKESYPCKIDIFNDTWEQVTETPGTYRKKGICKFIKIPEGDVVTLMTLEGERVCSHPNYIALGAKDEVYSYSPEFVEKDLEII